jgi:probable phosphoglycerate mutase
MASTKLLLIRHGQTDDNHRGVFQGQQGRGLNDRGRDQAAQLAARLSRTGIRVDAIHCSDLARARETAEILGEALGLAPREDPDLREVWMGAWEGLTRAEVQARFPEEWAAWNSGVDVRRGGGETYAELGARMTRALRRIAAQHAGRSAAIVSHGAAIKTFTAGMLGVPVEQMRAFQVPTNTGVCLVEQTEEGRFRLVVWNDAAHLGDALAAALAAPP